MRCRRAASQSCVRCLRHLFFFTEALQHQWRNYTSNRFNSRTTCGNACEHLCYICSPCILITMTKKYTQHHQRLLHQQFWRKTNQTKELPQLHSTRAKIATKPSRDQTSKPAMFSNQNYCQLTLDEVDRCFLQQTSGSTVWETTLPVSWLDRYCASTFCKSISAKGSFPYSAAMEIAQTWKNNSIVFSAVVKSPKPPRIRINKSDGFNLLHPASSRLSNAKE